MLGAAIPQVVNPNVPKEWPVCENVWEDKRANCAVTASGILSLPHRLAGMEEGGITGFIPDLIDIAVWGGLAYLLFMRGR